MFHEYLNWHVYCELFYLHVFTKCGQFIFFMPFFVTRYPNSAPIILLVRETGTPCNVHTISQTEDPENNNSKSFFLSTTYTPVIYLSEQVFLINKYSKVQGL